MYQIAHHVKIIQKICECTVNLTFFYINTSMKKDGHLCIINNTNQISVHKKT